MKKYLQKGIRTLIYIKKWVSITVIISIIFSVTCCAFAADASSITPATFSQSGNKLVYSDSPESFTLTGNCLQYLYGTGLKSPYTSKGVEYYKDVEYYHDFYNGSGTSKNRIGMVVQNLSSNTIRVYIKESCSSWSSKSTKDSNGKIIKKEYINTKDDTDIASNTVDICQKDLCAFENATTKDYYDIAPHQSQIVWDNKFQFVKGQSIFAYGRAQVYYTLSPEDTLLKGAADSRAVAAAGIESDGKVYLRVFVADQNKTAKDVFGKKSAIDGNGHNFCGELDFTQNNTILDSNSDQPYDIFEWKASKNVNEYPPKKYHYKKGSPKIRDGNFGIVYNLDITNNAANKFIVITPNWSALKTTDKASILISINDGPWQAPDSISYNMCWERSLGSNKNANVKIILPGGNSGNYKISFIKIKLG